ncbi:hypothetical protein KJ909_01310 [Patescibacteria group bacterium]|nr:hypothetical protein [Patescibacteria group bacterium]
MTKKNLPLVLAVFLLVPFLFFYPRPLQSAPPTSVKDTLSNSQLSFFARLAVGNSATDTLLKIATSGNPSNTTNNLFVGDTLGIGATNVGTTVVTTALNTYTIRDIGNTAQFQVNTGISTSEAYTGAAVIATRSAIHTVTFTPKSSIMGGAWQFLIKATSRTGEDENDGIPDQQGFDLGQDVGSTSTGPGTRLKTADVTCPFGATASVGTTVVVNTNSYHIIKCQLGAGITNPIDAEATLTVGRALTTGSQLINPAPALSHTEGKADSTADTYTFYIRHLDSGNNVIDADTATGKIAVVESVRVTATVDPTLSFIIDNTNVGSGATICGNTLGSPATNTTATSVSYGSLSLGAFNDLAQRLSCVTNADGGYIVTVYEIDPMTGISTGTTIPDTDCDGACNTVTAAEWTTDTSNSGWGYSLQNINVGTTLFNYNVGGATFAAKAFANGASNAKQIMKNITTPTTTERAYICYRLTASTIQKAGNYENQLIYTATATF